MKKEKDVAEAKKTNRNEQKSGFVSIIGRPNVGKSTLMNHLIGQKIAITSSKPQTTRNQIRTVLTEERGQIVFIDTPGVQKARNKLGEYMEKATNQGLRDVDAIIWIVEASRYIGENDRAIAKKLAQTKTPVILVINKIDAVEKKELFEITDMFRKLMEFTEIVPVCALRGTNVDELLKVLFEQLPEGPLYFDPDTITDQPEKQLAAELIREKALRLLSDEVPHGVAVAIDRMQERPKSKPPLIDIEAVIICERDSHKGIIIGKGGEMLKKIGSSSRHDMERLFGERVNLKIWVKVKKDWRDSDYLIRNFGYDRKEL